MVRLMLTATRYHLTLCLCLCFFLFLCRSENQGKQVKKGKRKDNCFFSIEYSVKKRIQKSPDFELSPSKRPMFLKRKGNVSTSIQYSHSFLTSVKTSQLYCIIYY